LARTADAHASMSWRMAVSSSFMLTASNHSSSRLGER
jgi:hypothetical protein